MLKALLFGLILGGDGQGSSVSVKFPDTTICEAVKREIETDYGRFAKLKCYGIPIAISGVQEKEGRL